MDRIKTHCENNIGTICLDHPEKRNALSDELVAQTMTALGKLADERCRVVILQASPGTKVFSAGHDVAELPEGRRDPLGWDDPLRHLVRAIEQHPAPVIAMVEGSVWGGACEVVLACDLIIAADTSTFALTPAKLGVPYNVSGILTFLSTAPLHIVKEMIFTAEPITASHAQQVGIVNRVVSVKDLEDVTLQYARTIAGNAPLAISVMKEQLRILAGAHPMSPQGFERVQGLRRVVYDSSDYREGIRAFKEKRKPVFEGR